MVAQVFKQQYLARFKLAGKLFGNLADAVRRESHVDGFANLFVQQFAQPIDHRAQ